jgi:hypothetical protein
VLTVCSGGFSIASAWYASQNASGRVGSKSPSTWLKRSEPVKRLADEDHVDRVVGERDAVRAARKRFGLRHNPPQYRPHAVERLDRNDPREPADELPRQLPRAGSEIEHDGVRRQIDGVERRLGVPGPPSFVRLGRAIEAAR